MVLQEATLMEDVSHPFIVELRYVFSGPRSMFLGMEYGTGTVSGQHRER